MGKGTSKFLIVRHPLERLISCFRDKFEGAIRPYYYVKFGEKMVSMYRPRPKELALDEVNLFIINMILTFKYQDRS